jgi:hypothetical protein
LNRTSPKLYQWPIRKASDDVRDQLVDTATVSRRKQAWLRGHGQTNLV